MLAMKPGDRGIITLRDGTDLVNGGFRYKQLQVVILETAIGEITCRLDVSFEVSPLVYPRTMIVRWEGEV